MQVVICLDVACRGVPAWAFFFLQIRSEQVKFCSADHGAGAWGFWAKLPVPNPTLGPIFTLEREGLTIEPAQERRAMRRFDMRLPALVKLTGDVFQELLTETLNVSARGVFFYIDRPVEHGTKIEVTLTLPSHVTLTESVRVRFTAHVVRVEAPLPLSRIGVAALIEEYEFLPSPHAQKAVNTS